MGSSVLRSTTATETETAAPEASTDPEESGRGTAVASAETVEAAVAASEDAAESAVVLLDEFLLEEDSGPGALDVAKSSSFDNELPSNLSGGMGSPLPQASAIGRLIMGSL